MSERMNSQSCDLSRRKKAICDLRDDIGPQLTRLLEEVELPATIAVGLPDWIAAVARDDQSAFDSEDRLLETFGWLSVLYLSAHSFQAITRTRRSGPPAPDLILTPKTWTDPSAARAAQVRIAEILIAARGEVAHVLLAPSFARERDTLHELSRRIAQAQR